MIHLLYRSGAITRQAQALRAGQVGDMLGTGATLGTRHDISRVVAATFQTDPRRRTFGPDDCHVIGTASAAVASAAREQQKGYNTPINATSISARIRVALTDVKIETGFREDARDGKTAIGIQE